MRFLGCLLATAVLSPAANASPTSILPSFLSSWPQSLNSLRREPSLKTDGVAQFEKRQSASAFDHDSDGSSFLWVPQDTYQGNTFFECVATIPAKFVYLGPQQPVELFHGGRSNQVSRMSCLTEVTHIQSTRQRNSRVSAIYTSSLM